MSTLPPATTTISSSSSASASAPSSFSSFPSPARDTALHPSHDARHIVRLGQCAMCSRFLHEAVTLPCGNSICRACLPPPHLRKNISYPALATRRWGFQCPFGVCRREHASEDCSGDVALNKILLLVHAEMQKLRDATTTTATTMRLAVRALGDQEDAREVCTSPGGRLAATYALVREERLDYMAEICYPPMCVDEGLESLDMAVMQNVKELARTELDCQVCYAVFLDPVTLSCGHTFCRPCVHRVLDHANLCPVCRRPLLLSPGLSRDSAPTNALLATMIHAFCPDALTGRQDALHMEEQALLGDLDTPLFICTLSFPSMPTFLHIFEPRYRLMMRRVLENHAGRFGMLLHNPAGEAQGDLGRVPFFQYGTMLQIENAQLLPDGRSLIEARGVSRFRVLRHGQLDGYAVGRVSRIDDISLAAEEALEAAETSPASPTASNFAARSHDPEIMVATNPPQLMTPPTTQDSPASSPVSIASTLPASSTRTAEDQLSTKALMSLCTEFMTRMQSQSAPWLTSRVYAAYGACPRDDPALFPWWFATVLPIVDAERYRLLNTVSVRERLKVCVGWVHLLDGRSQL